MSHRPGRFLARALLVVFATSPAWGQRIELSAVPQVPVGVGSVGAAPLAGAALGVAVGRNLTLPTAVGVSRVVALNQTVAGVRLSPASRIALAGADVPTLAHLEDLVARVSALGGSDRSRPINRYYDRSQGPSAQPIAAALKGSPEPSAPGAARAQGDSGGNGPSGPTGKALLAQVEAQAKQYHRGVSYDEARAFMFRTGHHIVRGEKQGILEVYTQTFVPGTSDRGADYHGVPGGEWDRDGMNAEHVWPQSFFAKKLPMRSDLHNLLPTFVHPNSLRGHMPFGEVQGKPEYSNRAGAKLGGGGFEPPPAAKGQIARAIMYFVARYGDDAVRQGEYGENFFNARIEMFLRWNREHPPTPAEKATNDYNAGKQGNRNPFIDDYTLADRIGVEGFRFDPGRANRPTNKEFFDFRPYTSHTAIIHTTGMRPHQEQRSRAPKSSRGPATQQNGRRKKR